MKVLSSFISLPLTNSLILYQSISYFTVNSFDWGASEIGFLSIKTGPVVMITGYAVVGEIRAGSISRTGHVHITRAALLYQVLSSRPADEKGEEEKDKKSEKKSICCCHCRVGGAASGWGYSGRGFSAGDQSTIFYKEKPEKRLIFLY